MSAAPADGTSDMAKKGAPAYRSSASPGPSDMALMALVHPPMRLDPVAQAAERDSFRPKPDPEPEPRVHMVYNPVRPAAGSSPSADFLVARMAGLLTDLWTAASDLGPDADFKSVIEYTARLSFPDATFIDPRKK